MTKVQVKGEVVAIKALLESDRDFIRSSVKAAIEAALEAEVMEALGAAKSERSKTWLGYRAGYYQRSLITRVGALQYGSRRPGIWTARVTTIWPTAFATPSPHGHGSKLSRSGRRASA